ncbi:DUF6531 domain-containing protein, partial [Pseudomonas indica]|uniref:DUF6531 domain-containing protein n=1 Tax=Pseudomonas indica TaxID=137658 RepID=UPI001140D5F3
MRYSGTFFKFLMFVFGFILVSPLWAGEWVFPSGFVTNRYTGFYTVEDACRKEVYLSGYPNSNYRGYSEYGEVKGEYICYCYSNYNGDCGYVWPACPENTTYDPEYSMCQSGIDIGGSLGVQDPAFSKNSPPMCAANPINVSIGNKVQAEVDLSPGSGSPFIEFGRFYNSYTGKWVHSFSDHLVIGQNEVFLINSSGRRSRFIVSGAGINPEAKEMGRLEHKGGVWIYSSSSNDILTFDDGGRLIKVKENGRPPLEISYSSGVILVKDVYGNVVEFSEDADHQPVLLSSGGLEIRYSYNGGGQLDLVEKRYSDRSEVRRYHYTNPNPKLLTGITDERGIRYATWTYDDQGRAISSEHANGAEKVTLSYNADGSTTVTNELGKQTV